ncbi:MAG: NADH-quinone oxidoreductase subunit C [Candidatus Methanomethylicia archaeon]
MTIDEINRVFKDLKSMIEPEAQVSTLPPNRLVITASIDKLELIANLLKNYGFDHVKSVTATDYPMKNVIEISYLISSFNNLDLSKIILTLKILIDRSKSTSKSLCKVWPSAEFLERETYDLMGIFFEGHPENASLILPEDYKDIRPLRKDFKLTKY